MAMIKLTGINKIYRTNEIETLALENVNLDVAKGEFVSIMGPSGCGKSTLLNIMGLLDAPSSGKIEINGTSVESMKDKELAAFRNKTLGFVFQSFHLINSLNVIDNVELPLLYRKMAAKERTRLAKEVLDRVGLSHSCFLFQLQLILVFVTAHIADNHLVTRFQSRYDFHIFKITVTQLNFTLHYFILTILNK